MLIGNLTRDPEVRYTPKQVAVATFGLATNREWSGANGEKQSSVEFHNLVAWQKLADICKSYLHKGDKIYVEGHLQTREWKAQDGSSRRTTEIIVENMIMLPRGGSSYGGDMGYSGSASAPAMSESDDAMSSTAGDDMPMDDESDIPF